jgi:hypothetical protein
VIAAYGNGERVKLIRWNNIFSIISYKEANIHCGKSSLPPFGIYLFR